MLLNKTILKDTAIIKTPRIIHFIWAGGQKLLPEDSVKSIALWARENINFKIFIWIDSATSKKTKKDLEQIYLKQFSEHAVTEQQIEFKDIREEGMIDDFSQYEIEKNRPNYGASSDLLRYKILYTYGGAYFDSDIHPAQAIISQLGKVITLSELEIFKDPSGHNILYVEHLSQLLNAKITSQTDITFNSKLARIGNDSFVCTKNNPLMQLIYNEAKENYSSTTAFANRQNRKEDEIRILLAYGANNRRLTIALTGPSHVRAVIASKDPTDCIDAVRVNLEQDQVLIKALRTKDYCLTEPLRNTLNWLKIFITKRNSIEESIKVTLNIIKFELENFGILRLEDHVKDISESCDVSYKEFIKIFLEEVKPIIKEGISANKLKVCAFLWEYHEIESLYSELQLNNRTFHNSPVYLPLIITQATSQEIMSEVIESERHARLEEDYNPAQREQVLLCMQRGLLFVNNFFNKGRLDKNIHHLIAEILIDYKRVIDIFINDNQMTENLSERIKALTSLHKDLIQNHSKKLSEHKVDDESVEALNFEDFLSLSKPNQTDSATPLSTSNEDHRSTGKLKNGSPEL